MRRYVPSWEEIGIQKDRYLELLHFCRQYMDWKREASSLVGIRGQDMDGMPHGNGVGDPVARAAERRERLLERIALIDRCAQSVDGGEWYRSLILNVCLGRPYGQINPILFPTSKRSDFFRARRAFFLRLHTEKEARDDEAKGGGSPAADGPVDDHTV